MRPVAGESGTRLGVALLPLDYVRQISSWQGSAQPACRHTAILCWAQRVHVHIFLDSRRPTLVWRTELRGIERAVEAVGGTEATPYVIMSVYFALPAHPLFSLLDDDDDDDDE